MALPSATISFPSTSITTFHEHLKSSKRIIALLGAGLSASSGLSTYRGVGSGLWHNHDPAKLATPEAFAQTPELVWRFHEDRRREALSARPNPAHFALAELAKVAGPENFMALNMNTDGLCIRAGHPRNQLAELHGNLFDLICSNKDCKYQECSDLDTSYIQKAKSDDDEKARTEELKAIPRCPQCYNFLRPGIVWFRESLRADVVHAAESFIDGSDDIDLVLVIGTTAQVWPAAGFVDSAVEKGARVAMVNIDRGDLVPNSGELGLTSRDWFFVGDAAELVPKLLSPMIDKE